MKLGRTHALVRPTEVLGSCPAQMHLALCFGYASLGDAYQIWEQRKEVFPQCKFNRGEVRNSEEILKPVISYTRSKRAVYIFPYIGTDIVRPTT